MNDQPDTSQALEASADEEIDLRDLTRDRLDLETRIVEADHAASVAHLTLRIFAWIVGGLFVGGLVLLLTGAFITAYCDSCESQTAGTLLGHYLRLVDAVMGAASSIFMPILGMIVGFYFGNNRRPRR